VLTLSQAIAARVPGDPTPLTLHEVPRELVPLVTEMNKLLSRATALLEHERRLTADAAHELRTPLAALKAQWKSLAAPTIRPSAPAPPPTSRPASTV
jgi:two-component system sensor histidine kinase QseC